MQAAVIGIGVQYQRKVPVPTPYNKDLNSKRAWCLAGKQGEVSRVPVWSRLTVQDHGCDGPVGMMR